MATSLARVVGLVSLVAGCSRTGLPDLAPLPVDDAALDGATSCTSSGRSCASPADCCPGANCNGVCTDGCGAPGDNCVASSCCTGECVKGTCRAADAGPGECKANGQACGASNECCGRECVAGKCAATPCQPGDPPVAIGTSELPTSVAAVDGRLYWGSGEGALSAASVFGGPVVRFGTITGVTVAVSGSLVVAVSDRVVRFQARTGVQLDSFPIDRSAATVWARYAVASDGAVYWNSADQQILELPLKAGASTRLVSETALRTGSFAVNGSNLYYFRADGPETAQLVRRDVSSGAETALLTGLAAGPINGLRVVAAGDDLFGCDGDGYFAYKLTTGALRRPPLGPSGPNGANAGCKAIVVDDIDVFLLPLGERERPLVYAADRKMIEIPRPLSTSAQAFDGLSLSADENCLYVGVSYFDESALLRVAKDR